MSRKASIICDYESVKGKIDVCYELGSGNYGISELGGYLNKQ